MTRTALSFLCQSKQQYNNNNNNNNNNRTMFMVLSSWRSHCKSSPTSADECIGCSKKAEPRFYFCDNFHKCIPDFNHFTITTRIVWCIKVKLRLPLHLYSVTPYLAKHTLLLTSMLHFRTCIILQFTQNSLVVLIPYLLAYSQQCFVTTILTSYCVYA